MSVNRAVPASKWREVQPGARVPQQTRLPRSFSSRLGPLGLPHSWQGHCPPGVALTTHGRLHAASHGSVSLFCLSGEGHPHDSHLPGFLNTQGSKPALPLSLALGDIQSCLAIAGDFLLAAGLVFMQTLYITYRNNQCACAGTSSCPVPTPADSPLVFAKGATGRVWCQAFSGGRLESPRHTVTC